ncbi:Iron ABC transporter substrate-binding protein [uncultured Desulfobacterium sp.]|uniref:Iron ABC transporter substrate-binding protein n=1 Tax=uncultured Desulfobacterium sp. TaxID=201089 RepID=A0A445N0U5_9BACT|nr:Iron ABC transporter substrate-binding protein [uncultured Desulfobacterium sp.]
MIKWLYKLICLLSIVIVWDCPVTAQAEAKTNTIVDSLGRQVKVPVVIKRIACMYAFTGHVVAMLGRADDIVAVSNGLKRDVLLSTMYPSIKKALSPKFQGAVNIEELARAKPDIVFVGVDTGGNQAEAAKLDACGLTWLAVDFHSMQEQQQAVTMIGRAIGSSDRAVAYNDYYNSCISRVGKAVAAIPQEDRITIYHATVEPTRTSPKNSLPTDWIRAAGVINVAAREQGVFDQNHQIGIEQIILWNPEVILVNEPGAGELIMKNPKWAAISAVEKGRVYQMPIGISRWGHPGSLETPLAILWTAKTVYPGQFKDLDMQAETGRFYKKFFDYTLSEKMVRQILQGKGMRLSKDRKKRQ